MVTEKRQLATSIAALRLRHVTAMWGYPIEELGEELSHILTASREFNKMNAITSRIESMSEDQDVIEVLMMHLDYYDSPIVAQL